MNGFEEMQDDKIKYYYIVKKRYHDLEKGLIFCLIRNQANLCINSKHRSIIYSKDLTKLIPYDDEINDKLNENIHFEKINENLVKYLYPIKPFKSRLIAKIDVSNVEAIKEGSYVMFKSFNLSFSTFAIVHRKEEIGGCYFYLLHGCSKNDHFYTTINNISLTTLEPLKSELKCFKRCNKENDQKLESTNDFRVGSNVYYPFNHFKCVGAVESIIIYSNKVFISGKFNDVSQEHPMFPILNFDNNFFIESEKLESSEAKFINNNHSTFAPIEQKNLKIFKKVESKSSQSKEILENISPVIAQDSEKIKIKKSIPVLDLIAKTQKSANPKTNKKFDLKQNIPKSAIQSRISNLESSFQENSKESFGKIPIKTKKIENSIEKITNLRNTQSPVPIPIPIPNLNLNNNLDSNLFLNLLSRNTHRISADLLSFKDIKSLLFQPISDHDFEKEKLEKLLLQLPKNKYFFTTDWINAFSIGEIKRYFFHELKLEEINNFKIEELKKRIALMQTCAVDSLAPKNDPKIEHKPVVVKVDPDENLCKICVNNMVECVFSECGHMICCMNCSSNLKTCPICRKKIVIVIKVFK